MCGVEDHLQYTYDLVKAEKTLHTFWQKHNMTN